MKNTYALLDETIVTRITFGSKRFAEIFAGDVAKLAGQLGRENRQEPPRVVDKRLQALRKKGRISYMKTGWVVLKEAA